MYACNQGVKVVCFLDPKKHHQKEDPNFGEERGHPQWVPRFLVVFRGYFWLFFLGPSFREERVPVFTRRMDTAC